MTDKSGGGRKAIGTISSEEPSMLGKSPRSPKPSPSPKRSPIVQRRSVSKSPAKISNSKKRKVSIAKQSPRKGSTKVVKRVKHSEEPLSLHDLIHDSRGQSYQFEESSSNLKKRAPKKVARDFQAGKKSNFNQRYQDKR